MAALSTRTAGLSIRSTRATPHAPPNAVSDVAPEGSACAPQLTRRKRNAWLASTTSMSCMQHATGAAESASSSIAATVACDSSEEGLAVTPRERRCARTTCVESRSEGKKGVGSCAQKIEYMRSGSACRAPRPSHENVSRVNFSAKAEARGTTGLGDGHVEAVCAIVPL